MKRENKISDNSTINDPLLIPDTAYFAELMESIRDAVISVNEGSIIRSWNKGAEYIYGWSPDEAIGKHYDELLHTNYGEISIEKLTEDFKEQGHYRSEVLQQTRSGVMINILVSASAIFDNKRELTGAVIINKDISERKKLEGQLKELNEKLREQVDLKTKEIKDIFERITDGFIALDTEWCYTYANKRIGDLIRQDPGSLIGKNVWDLFPEAIGSSTYNAFHEAMKEQKFKCNVDYFEPLDLWQENDIYPSPEGITVFIRDITETKRAEEKLIKANRLYFFISQINQMIVRVKDEATLFKDACNISVNVGQFRMAWIGMLNTGIKKIVPVMHAGEETAYLKKIIPISLDDVEAVTNPTGNAIREGKLIICNDIESTPEMLPWKGATAGDGYRSSIVFPLKKFGKVIGAFSFYAKAKNFFDKQEIALLEEATGDVSFALENFEREKLRAAAEAATVMAYKENEITLNRISDSVVSVDNEWHYTFLNDAALATHPLGREETIGKSMWEVHPEMRGTVFWDKYHEAMEKKISIEIESYYKPFDTWFYVKIYPSAEGLTFFYTDITNRKRAEDVIRNSEEKIRLIMTAALDAIICMDTKGIITFWNPQAEKIFGWKAEEVLGLRLSGVIIPPPFRKMHEKGMEEYLQTGHGPVLNVLIELTAINRDNKEFPVELTVLPIKQADEEFFCAFIRDISHRREEEKRIAKATITAQEEERHHIGLELHDNVNQILVGSLLNLGMIKQGSDENIREIVNISKKHIMNAIEEIRKLSHQLAPASFDDVSLQQAFESLLLSVNTDNNYTIEIHFDDLNQRAVNTGIQINLYRILQEQLNNIIKYSKADRIEISVTVHDKFVRLRIFDNGIGFDPQKVKKGIGLGNIKKRAELFSGSFSLNTSNNNGCEIIVEIPLENKN